LPTGVITADTYLLDVITAYITVCDVITADTFATDDITADFCARDITDDYSAADKIAASRLHEHVMQYQSIRSCDVIPANTFM
jgi:CRISPR/Cas system CSM-associated protein Csm3 (group 7 of RAMP superfamily)